MSETYYSLDLAVPDSLRAEVEVALTDLGFRAAVFPWKKIHSPKIGGTDKKAKYRDNESARLAAKLIGVSHGSVSTAKRVFANAPEMKELVLAGTLTMQDAVRQLKSEGRWKRVKELK